MRKKKDGFTSASIRIPYKQVVRELCGNYEGFFLVALSTWIDHFPRFVNSPTRKTPVEILIPQALNAFLPLKKYLDSQLLYTLVAWMTGKAGGIRWILDELLLAGGDAEEKPFALMQHARCICREFFVSAAGGFDWLPDNRQLGIFFHTHS